MNASTLLRFQRVVAAAMAVLVLVLAVIAGRSSRLFGTWDIEVHGWIGNAVFVLALANVGLALASRTSRSAIGVAGAIAILTFAQVGLGYVGREQLDAAAWHVPNGVLLMALATYQYAGLRFGAGPFGNDSPAIRSRP